MGYWQQVTLITVSDVNKGSFRETRVSN